MINSEKRNILVVDDEVQIARVLKTTLSAQGYGIRTAADGQLALEEMKNWVPDLIITDLRMPNMDGLELCRVVLAPQFGGRKQQPPDLGIGGGCPASNEDQ